MVYFIGISRLREVFLKENTFLKVLGLGALAVLLFLFAPFLKSLSVALLLAMAIYPLHHTIHKKLLTSPTFNQSSNLIATSLVTLCFATIFFVPLTLFLFHLFEQPTHIIELIRSLGNQVHFDTNSLPASLEWLKDPLQKLVLLAQANQDTIIAFLTKWLSSGLKTFLAMISEIGMILVFFFFLMLYARPILLFISPIIPLSRSIKRQFFRDMSSTMAVVFYTLLGVMIAQGIAFGVFIAFFDGYNSILLGFLTGITSIIPVFGTALVWIPVALKEYFAGNTMHAIIIVLYAWAVMSFFIDNIVKLLILNFVNRSLSKGKVHINEFIIFFAIIGGLTTFGFWGFLIGPALVAFSTTAFRTLRKLSRPTHH